MKGLILKDLYNIKFQLIGGILIFLYPNVLIWLASGDEEPLFPEAAMALPYIALNLLTIAVCSAFVLNTLIDDFKSGWAKIQRTMPLSSSQIVGAKLITIAIVLLILMTLSLICNIVSATLDELPLEPMLTSPVVASLFQMIPLCVSAMAGYRSKTRLIVPVFFTIESIVVVCAVLLAFLTLSGYITLNVLRIIAYVAVPVATAVVASICVKAANKAVDS